MGSSQERQRVSRVLVAERDGKVAADLAVCLSALGYEVTGTASTAEEAVRKVEETSPDLVMMDLRIIGGMDASEAARDILSRLEVPVVFLSPDSAAPGSVCAEAVESGASSSPVATAYAFAGPLDRILREYRTIKRLRESEELFRAIFENAVQAMALTDSQGGYIRVNSAWQEMFGYTLDEAQSLTVLDLTHPEEVQASGERFESLLRGDVDTYRLIKRYVRKDGTFFWADLQATRINAQEKGGVACVSVIEDVTERKRAREELQAREENYRTLYEESKRTEVLYRSLLDWSPDAVVIYDLEGRVQYFNDLFAKMFGWTLDELRGKRVPYVPDSEKELSMGWIREVLNHGVLCAGFDTKRYTKDGRVLDVSLSGSRFPDHEGKPVGIMAIIRDITERKSAEEQIRASLREKEILIREVHHRVKNNLQVIQSLLRLQSRFAADESHRRMFDDAQDRVRSMALVHEKLYRSENLARLEIPAYVCSLVNDLVASYAGVGGRISVHREIGDVSFGLDTAVPLGFIITELFSNCLKHAFTDGRDGRIKLILRRLDDVKFELVIADNGVGLPENVDLENPRTLGLELVRIFARQLQGQLDIRSIHGTEFRLQFMEVK